MAKKLLVVSDLHCGSQFALMPPVWEEQLEDTDMHITHQCSAAQMDLYREWKKMCQKVGKVDDVVINGDLVDGPNKKSNGKGTWTNDLQTQALCAAHLILMIKAKRYHVTFGSPYHTGDNLNADALVGRILKSAGKEVKSGYEVAITYKDEDSSYHFAHGISVSQVFHYRSTPIAREMMSAILNEKQIGKYNGIIRSHCHYYCAVEYGHSFGLITPGWKMRDSYGVKKGFGIIPRCGYVVLHVSKKRQREDIEKYIFSPTIRSTLVRSVIRG